MQKLFALLLVELFDKCLDKFFCKIFAKINHSDPLILLNIYAKFNLDRSRM